MNIRYFTGDSLTFGEEGKYYKWIIPFPKDNWDFVEVSKEEYDLAAAGTYIERAIGAAASCVPCDPAAGPENIGNKVLRTYPPGHVRNCCLFIQ